MECYMTFHSTDFDGDYRQDTLCWCNNGHKSFFFLVFENKKVTGVFRGLIDWTGHGHNRMIILFNEISILSRILITNVVFYVNFL